MKNELIRLIESNMGHYLNEIQLAQLNECLKSILIIEMCYGFDFQAIYDCGGYWDRDFVWHKEAMNVPLEVINNMSLS